MASVWIMSMPAIVKLIVLRSVAITIARMMRTPLPANRTAAPAAATVFAPMMRTRIAALVIAMLSVGIPSVLTRRMRIPVD